MRGSVVERTKTITGGVKLLSTTEKEETKKSCIRGGLLLSRAASLCRSVQQNEERLTAAYFESVRTLLTRVEGKGKISFKEVNERINDLLKQSIKSEGVINLFSDIHEEFSLFDPKFLEEISKMKEKNFAVELLRKLIAEQVRMYERTNAVRSAKFSAILSNAMSNYLNGLSTNEEAIAEILKAAHYIVNCFEEFITLNLTEA